MKWQPEAVCDSPSVFLCRVDYWVTQFEKDFKAPANLLLASSAASLTLNYAHPANTACGADSF